MTHWKRPWCWERLKAGEGDDRGWDGWMASLIWWAWVWASSGSWWWTGKPGVLQFKGSQRVRHDWATEMNWTELMVVGGSVAKSCLTLATPWTVACQVPLSLGFSRQEYWSGLPFPSPGDLPNPGVKPKSPSLQADSLGTELPGKSYIFVYILKFSKATFRQEIT